MYIGKIVTLYIDDTSIRLLEASGGRIQKWADLQLEPGLVKGGIVLQETEIANRIKQLMSDQKIAARSVILGFSGLHSSTRPIMLPILPKAMLQEAVLREARRLLPVPLDQLYVSWKTIPAPKGKIQVFLAATPRKTADSLVKTLRLAGLEPRHMALKPLVLTRTVKETTAMVVDVQPNEFDIIIMSDGISQPIRTVALPAEVESWEQKLGMIIDDLSRTIKFFDSNNPEKPLAPEVPIYVSGELSSRPEMQKALSESMGHPVNVLPPILKSAEPVDLGRYMVNIALSLKSVTSGSESGYSVSNLNVLPAPYQSKGLSMTRIIAVPGAAAVVALVVSMVVMVQNTSANIASMQYQLDNTNQMVNQVQTQKKTLTTDVTDLEKKVAAVKRSNDTVSQAVKILGQVQEGVKGDLQVAITSLPSSLRITEISHAVVTLTVNGTAQDEGGVLSYARGLDNTGRFKEVTVAALKMNKDGGLDFSIILKRKG
jgi:type IV pilus assembly protein PilM